MNAIPLKFYFHKTACLELDRAFYNNFKLDIDYNSVYIDLDDCLIIDGKVNVLLMAFIYQCINNKKKIHLLTRHEGEIEQYLVNHNLHHLFDGVVCINKGESKSDAIAHKVWGEQSIFIDDSFGERKEVKEKLHIPVMRNELIRYLELDKGQTVLDCTLGGGGHADMLLQEIGPSGRVVGIDRDREALKITQDRLKRFNNLILIQGNFRNIDVILKVILD